MEDINCIFFLIKYDVTYTIEYLNERHDGLFLEGALEENRSAGPPSRGSRVLRVPDVRTAEATRGGVLEYTTLP